MLEGYSYQHYYFVISIPGGSDFCSYISLNFVTGLFSTLVVYYINAHI